MARRERLGSLRLLLIAGIDTTWSGIGSCIWHLAKTPEDRRRLVEEPALMPTAIEEFLRAYAPVTMAREVVKETEINGCTFKPGQMVMLSFPAANRDPAMFADADKVIIDRKENRHAAFGLGIHRCVGSNLARMEMTVAVEELLKRIPEFSLAGEVTWSEGTVRGPAPAADQVLEHSQEREGETMSQRPPGEGLGHRLRPSRPELGQRSLSDLGRAARRSARSRTPSASSGVYLPSRYEDVRAIAYDPEHFSSRKVVVRETPPPANNGAPPITSDPPRHRLARMVLLPPFTPQAIDKLRAEGARASATS